MKPQRVIRLCICVKVEKQWWMLIIIAEYWQQLVLETMTEKKFPYESEMK